MKSIPPSHGRLEQAATLVARRADSPGGRRAVAEYLDDVDGRWLRGRLTLEQRFRLYAILLRGAPAPRAPASAV
jgi:hypothetical protein